MHQVTPSTASQQQQQRRYIEEVTDLRSSCPESSLKNIKQQHPECRWYLRSKVGQGAVATVYQACCNNDCKFVAKVLNSPNVERLREKVNHEVEMHERFEKLGLAPKVHDAWLCNHEAIIIMDKLHMSIPEYVKYMVARVDNVEPIVRDLQRRVNEALLKAHQAGLVHGDTHLGNFMVKLDEAGNVIEDVQLIDFAHAKDVGVRLAMSSDTENADEIRMSFDKLLRDVKVFDSMVQQGEVQPYESMTYQPATPVTPMINRRPRDIRTPQSPQGLPKKRLNFFAMDDDEE